MVPASSIRDRIFTRLGNCIFSTPAISLWVTSSLSRSVTMNGKMPSANQAGVYASTLAYLNAVAATGSDDAKAVVPQMKKFKGRDKLFGDVTIRQDGRVIHPMYLFEVKKPEESKYPYDYYKLISTIPAEQAFRPMADGGCSLVK